MTELWKLTANELVPLIAERRISVKDTIASVLERIEAVNPAVNSIVQRMDEQALAAAEAADTALARGEAPGPLTGIAVTIKVNIDEAGFATTNGLRSQAGLVAEGRSAMAPILPGRSDTRPMPAACTACARRSGEFPPSTRLQEIG
jgi:amidase